MSKRLSQSVVRAVSILELLDKKGELGVTEISRELQLDKSTTFRLVSTLKACRFLAKSPSNSKYSNGYRLFELGQNVRHHRDLIAKAYPYMQTIFEKTGETVNFVVPEDVDVVFLEKIETEDILKVSHSIGERRPMYCTAVGKAILAHMDDEKLNESIDTFEFIKFTDTTIADRDALIQELATIRTLGYAVDNYEHSPYIRCVAAPLLNSRNEPVAAMSISVPIFKVMDKPEMFARCTTVLTEACLDLSRNELGHSL